MATSLPQPACCAPASLDASTAASTEVCCTHVCWSLTFSPSIETHVQLHGAVGFPMLRSGSSGWALVVSFTCSCLDSGNAW